MQTRYRPFFRRPAVRSPRDLGQALAGLLDRLDVKGGRRLTRLWKAWDELVGPEIAGLMRPLGHRAKTLLVSTDDPVVAQEASFLAPLLLERVNAFFGEEVFDKVGFELLSGRVPLAGKKTPAPAEPRQPLPRPPEVGGLLARLPADTPLGRCYRAYLRMFEQDRGPSGSGG